MFIAEIGGNTKEEIELTYGAKIKLSELLKQYHESLVTLGLPSVSQQRELLIDFLKEVRKDKDSVTFEQQVDTYLKSINCG